MVTLVAVHWVKPEDIDSRMELFLANSKKKAKGLISRQVLRSKSDPNKITTVTNFETMKDFENFFHIDPKRLNRGRTKEDPTDLDIYEDISPK